MCQMWGSHDGEGRNVTACSLYTTSYSRRPCSRVYYSFLFPQLPHFQPTITSDMNYFCFGKRSSNGKVFPVHVTKACKGSRGIAPHILHLGPSLRWEVKFRPRPRERTRQAVWTFWRKEESPAPTGIWTPHQPARSVVAIPATLLRLRDSAGTETYCDVAP